MWVYVCGLVRGYVCMWVGAKVCVYVGWCGVCGFMCIWVAVGGCGGMCMWGCNKSLVCFFCREYALASIKAGSKDILVATDVAGRGIDIR